MENTVVVVPNWNGKASLLACINSLLAQTYKNTIVIVENGSTDGSLEFLKDNFPKIRLIVNQNNLGFAGGVNTGIRFALDNPCKYVALFNNDAVADKDWLKHLVETIESDDTIGISTCKLLGADKSYLDSTGDYYTNWGLPYPRGRNETDLNKYNKQTEIFAASGGASIYRASMLKEIGLFDEDFFAYYEDVDISFRAQLAGWKIRFVPQAVAYHQIGATSSKIKGFTTYQTLKNLPLLLIKNVPSKYFWGVAWRFFIADTLFFFRAISRGHVWAAIKGSIMGKYLFLKKIPARRYIQASKKVSDEYIWDIMTHDLPPNASALRKLRNGWWKLIGRKA